MAKIDFSDQQVREAYRHTSSHIMAQAIKRIWPEAKLAIGPSIENGFFPNGFPMLEYCYLKLLLFLIHF